MTRDDSDTGRTAPRWLDNRKQLLTATQSDSMATGERRRDDENLSHGSRRRFLQVGATTLAATAIGSSSAVARSQTAERCGSEDQLEIGGGDFVLKNNDWGSSAVEMCIRVNADGSYGYEWATRTTGGQPNYPQVLLGTKPWGSDTGVADFPIRRAAVDQLEIEVDIDQNISGGKWNLAEEWWLMDQPVSEATGTHTHEIMLVLDWGGGHGNNLEEATVWTDTFGNTIDYWTAHSPGGTNADFHIFRVQGGLSTGRVDLKELIDFMSERYGISGQKWISGIELGNEYWQGTRGDVTYHQFDVTINGQRYTSGGGGQGRGGGNDGESGNEGDTGNGGGQPYPAWDSSKIYREGDRVTHDGTTWEAQWWTQGQEPRNEAWYVWQPVE
ncbi:carbohydrate-binding protein [Natrinema halophilum]|uniref:Chitin-binding type-3 domain-containing protein n=1 Tax=Natrinema halophilum TaxID=1699371 RepID=A0A7D5H3C2_9EURY|nr:carbohydrate-binding protein [Natrinema halophilum]